MRYDLPRMMRAGVRRRRPRPIRVRRPLDRFERELASILNDVVVFWTRQYEKPDGLADAEPEQVNGVDDEVLLAALTTRIRRWLADLAAWQRDMWVRRIREVTGVDVSSLASVPLTDPAVLTTLAWLDELLADLSRQAQQRVISSMRDATLRQLPKAAARSLVKEAMERVSSRANLIASDMVGKFHGQMNQALQEEAGVTRYKWNHSFLKNPRRHHVERQGNIYEWAKPPRGGHPGYEVNCRCTAEPVI